jgi:hypothetical protein
VINSGPDQARYWVPVGNNSWPFKAFGKSRAARAQPTMGLAQTLVQYIACSVDGGNVVCNDARCGGHRDAVFDRVIIIIVITQPTACIGVRGPWHATEGATSSARRCV